MVLTPTVLPNSFGVPPDLPVPYLFQARGLPRYGFCALEMPLNSFDSHLPVCGLLLPPVLLISSFLLPQVPRCGYNTPKATAHTPLEADADLRTVVLQYLKGPASPELRTPLPADWALESRDRKSVV